MMFNEVLLDVWVHEQRLIEAEAIEIYLEE